jgi:hypothetical protein
VRADQAVLRGIEDALQHHQVLRLVIHQQDVGALIHHLLPLTVQAVQALFFHCDDGHRDAARQGIALDYGRAGFTLS